MTVPWRDISEDKASFRTSLWIAHHGLTKSLSVSKGFAASVSSIYTDIYDFICISYTYTYTYINEHICMCVYTHTHTHTYTHFYMCVRVYVIYVFVWAYWKSFCQQGVHRNSHSLPRSEIICRNILYYIHSHICLCLEGMG
jgi:hypothetical protein